MAVVTVGVLALQGGFLEHLALLHRAAPYLAPLGHAFAFVQVRNPPDLARCDGLIIPGGESTTIALIAAQSGLLEPLRELVKSKPTWGTCAGLILLAEQANAAKKGGQELIGGLAVRVRRNHFGRQVESFVADVELPFLAQSDALLPSSSSSSSLSATAPFPGVFIRAPIVEELLSPRLNNDDNDDQKEHQQGPGAAAANKQQKQQQPVEILGVLPDRTKRVKGGGGGSGPLTEMMTTTTTSEQVEVNNIVAVRQGHVMGTSFHPELTDDVRIHVWWLEQVVKTLEVVPVG